MLYRCLTCDHEEDRGILPFRERNFYRLALLLLSSGGCFLVLLGLRTAVGPLGPVVGEIWLNVIVFGGVGLMVASAVGLHSLLGWAEYLVVRRRPCPVCGGRQWSFGL